MKQELLEQFNKETGITKPVDTDLDYYQSQYITWLEHQLLNKNDLLHRVSQHSELLKEIFSITAGAWDDPVISEDLYNRMEAAISFNYA